MLFHIIDENWKKLPIEEVHKDFEPRVSISVSLPNDEKETKVLIKALIYTCKNSVCTMEKIFYILCIKFSDSANRGASCSFSHTLS